MATYSSFKRINSAAIIDETIISDDFSVNAVTSSKILDNNITSAKIASGAVGSSQLASSLDLSSKTIIYRPVVNADIATGAAIPTSKISGLGTLATLNSISATEITNSAITNAKISASVNRVAYSAMAGYVGRNSNGYLRFSLTNGNTNIFGTPTDTSGTGGVQIKKAGAVSFVYTQDIVTSSSESSYFTTYVVFNNSRISPKLMRNTGSQWDGYQICGAFNCAVNDVIQIEFPSAPVSIDAGGTQGWSQFSLMWTGYDI